MTSGPRRLRSRGKRPTRTSFRVEPSLHLQLQAQDLSLRASAAQRSFEHLDPCTRGVPNRRGLDGEHGAESAMAPDSDRADHRRVGLEALEDGIHEHLPSVVAGKSLLRERLRLDGDAHFT